MCSKIKDLPDGPLLDAKAVVLEGERDEVEQVTGQLLITCVVPLLHARRQVTGDALSVRKSFESRIEMVPS